MTFGKPKRFKMTSYTVNETEAMKIALGQEEKGYQFYIETASNTKDSATRNIFEYLAKEEIRHIDKIKRWNEAIAQGVDFDFIVDLKEETLDETKELFGKTVAEFKEEVNAAQSDVEAYDFAMNLEKTSYNFYKKSRAEAVPEKLKGFFEFLMKEEEYHYLLLQNFKDFVTDPVSWNLENEKWIIEG